MMDAHARAAEALLDLAYRAVALGRDRDAVRALLEFVDAWLHDGSAPALHELYVRADLGRLGVTAALGVLAAAPRGADPWPEARADYVRRLGEHLATVRPDDAAELMRGVR